MSQSIYLLIESIDLMSTHILGHLDEIANSEIIMNARAQQMDAKANNEMKE